MIPLDFITEWRERAPWAQDSQVEQDLIISRALVEMYSNPVVANALAFRGGTALYKLYLDNAARYSEDIDFVQVASKPIGPVLDALHATLDRWLGLPKRSLKEEGAKLIYRFESEGPPAIPMRLKVEINTREHFSVLGFCERSFSVESRWFSGCASIRTYRLDELLGTKLRALYQRKKSRDLFDLWNAQRHGEVDPDSIVRCFLDYLHQSGLRVSRAEFEENLAAKFSDRTFARDIEPLLAPEVEWDFDDAVRFVQDNLLVRIPGDAWKGKE